VGVSEPGPEIVSLVGRDGDCITTPKIVVGEVRGRPELNAFHTTVVTSTTVDIITVFLRPTEWFVDEQYVFAYCNGSK
jgi:hypothetical protein